MTYMNLAPVVSVCVYGTASEIYIQRQSIEYLNSTAKIHIQLNYEIKKQSNDKNRKFTQSANKNHQYTAKKRVKLRSSKLEWNCVYISGHFSVFEALQVRFGAYIHS